MAFRTLTIGLAAVFLSLAASVSARAEMQFSLTTIGGSCGSHCPLAIVADGEITDSTPDEFVAFVRANARSRNVRSVVLLNSPGGKVVASMELGRVFRKVGAATVVARAVSDSEGHSHLAAGRCFSACVYALMGGRKRVVPAQSLVGVHRMFALEAGADPAGGGGGARWRFDNGDMRNTLSRYSQSMGVSRELIATAERTPTETLHLLSPSEVARWRLGSTRF